MEETIILIKVMPRKRQRFSRLDAALSFLRNPNNPDDPKPAPPNSILKEYEDFAANKKTLEYPRADTSKPGIAAVVGVQGFFRAQGSPVTETLILTTMSTRAKESANAKVGAARTAGGVDLTPGANGAAIVGFYPALAIIDHKTATDVPTGTKSQITGLERKGKVHERWSVPFGQKGAKTMFGEQVSEIRSAVVATDYSVSFIPEKYV